MNNKLKIRKVLKKAKKDLMKYKSLGAPVIQVKSNNANTPIVRIGMDWEDEISKCMAAREVHEICHNINADETLLVCIVNLNRDRTSIKDKEALMIKMERSDGIQRVAVPFKRNPNGNISFGKERWSYRTVKNPNSPFEGFIQ